MNKNKLKTNKTNWDFPLSKVKAKLTCPLNCKMKASFHAYNLDVFELIGWEFYQQWKMIEVPEVEKEDK